MLDHDQELFNAFNNDAQVTPSKQVAYLWELYITAERASVAAHKGIARLHKKLAAKKEQIAELEDTAWHNFQAMMTITSYLVEQNISTGEEAGLNVVDAFKGLQDKIAELEKELKDYNLLKDVIAHNEGLNITLEFNDGKKKCASRKVMTLIEIYGNPYFEENLIHRVKQSWKEIQDKH